MNRSLPVLRAFRCLRLRVRLKARRTIALPAYKGSTLRGALGMALKRCCCAARRRACHDCLLRRSCLYVYLFETRMAGEGPEDVRYRNAPRPFVLQLEVDGPTIVEAGECWSFDVTLVGRGAKWTPYVVMALQRMGELGIGKGRGTYDVERVVTLDAHGHPDETIYSEGTLRLPQSMLSANGTGSAVRSDGTAARSFRLRFVTPVRMVYRGELARIPEFHILIGNLARRLANLERFHCGGNGEVPVGDLIDRAGKVRLVNNRTRWYDWERYSHRQRRRMRLGGLLGEAVYEGDPARFEPFLTAGTWVNVGKNTSFGLGRYEVVTQKEGIRHAG